MNPSMHECTGFVVGDNWDIYCINANVILAEDGGYYKSICGIFPAIIV